MTRLRHEGLRVLALALILGVSVTWGWTIFYRYDHLRSHAVIAGDCCPCSEVK